MSMAPMTVSFSPGTGFGIVAWPTVALIESADPAVAERLWKVLVGGGDGNDLIDELSADGFRNLGSFVVAQIEGPDIRLFVRGRAAVRYTCADDAGEIDGSSVRTWIEQVVTAYESIDLAIDGPIGVDRPFSVTSGLVPADRLSWSVKDGRPSRAASPDEGATSTTTEKLNVPTDQSAEASPEEPMQTSSTEGQTDHDESVEQSVTTSSSLAAGEVVPPADSFTPHPSPPLPTGAGVRQSEPEVDERAELDVVDTGQTLHYDSLEGESPAVTQATDAFDPLPDGDVDEYDYDALFGHTTHRSVQDAVVEVLVEEEIDFSDLARNDSATMYEQPEPEPSQESTSSVPGLISAIPTTPVPGVAVESPGIEDPGDHDGLTMTVAQLRALRANGAPEAAVPLPAVSGGPTVQALVCGAGHPNPTVLDTCRRCGGSLAPAPVVIARPSLGRVQLSSGQTIELTRSAIVGRNPRVEGTMHGEVPSTLKIEGIQALSRSHAIIRLEGWQVMVEDLDSANGTTVTLQGRPPRRLRAGEPIILEHGALIDFGGEVTGTYDALA